MSHTPGPWEIVWESKFRWDVRYIKGGTPLQEVCRIYTVDPKTDDEDADNAQLIAAAPEMLEACEMALDYFNCPSLTREELRKMGERLIGAISKAKGKA